MAKPKMKISKSARKHIRTEKGRIRRSVASVEEQKKLIEEMYKPYRDESPAKSQIQVDSPQETEKIVK